MSAVIFDAEATFLWRRVRTEVARKRQQIAQIAAATEARRHRIAELSASMDAEIQRIRARDVRDMLPADCEFGEGA